MINEQHCLTSINQYCYLYFKVEFVFDDTSESEKNKTGKISLLFIKANTNARLEENIFCSQMK